jgi:N-carbamoylputrescine amidase
MTVAASPCTKLRVAVVQLGSVNGRLAANLRRATPFVEEAARDGAQLVLLPEFLATGYAWTTDLWDAAEPAAGPTVEWLGNTSRRLGVWLGVTYLEAERDDFYNTFVLTAPDGSEAGRVRKQNPALGEAFFFRGEAGPHVIDTPLGRIGVGICYDNYLAYFPQLMYDQSADLILMPHSAASFAEMFPICEGTIRLFQRDLREIAAYHAALLGVPTIMSNKCGPWDSGRPGQIPANFLGSSAIVDSDGRVKQQLAGEERVIVADVTLDATRKRTTRPPRFGRWARETSFWRNVVCWFPETAGNLCYRLSTTRRKHARLHSSSAGQFVG